MSAAIDAVMQGYCSAEEIGLLLTGLRLKGETVEAIKALESIRKIIFFDMALAIDTYIAAYLETMTRHQAAIRELSTPVIKVHDRLQSELMRRYREDPSLITNEV